jgi:Malectin domain
LFVPIRINCGGGNFTDSLGHVWRADAFFSGGETFSITDGIANTTNALLYQSERYGTTTYQIPVPPAPGRYDVTLHLAEI